MVFRSFTLTSLLFCAIAAQAYIQGEADAEWKKWPVRPVAQPPTKAVVLLAGPVNGTIVFEQAAGENQPVSITGTIRGLAPNALRGFHVHQYGNLTDGCTSTGAHFNPLNETHGAPTDTVRHVGDLGNIQSDDKGVAVINLTDNIISLSGPNSILGRGVVVHNGTDDLGKGGTELSSTTGNAGARSACGVIGIA